MAQPNRPCKSCWRAGRPPRASHPLLLQGEERKCSVFLYQPVNVGQKGSDARGFVTTLAFKYSGYQEFFHHLILLHIMLLSDVHKRLLVCAEGMKLPWVHGTTLSPTLTSSGQGTSHSCSMSSNEDKSSQAPQSLG